jgi:hypothetical protein
MVQIFSANFSIGSTVKVITAAQNYNLNIRTEEDLTTSIEIKFRIEKANKHYKNNKGEKYKKQLNKIIALCDKFNTFKQIHYLDENYYINNNCIYYKGLEEFPITGKALTYLKTIIDSKNVEQVNKFTAFHKRCSLNKGEIKNDVIIKTGKEVVQELYEFILTHNTPVTNDGFLLFKRTLKFKEGFKYFMPNEAIDVIGNHFVFNSGQLVDCKINCLTNLPSSYNVLKVFQDLNTNLVSAHKHTDGTDCEWSFGQYTYPDKLDYNSSNTCSSGLHFGTEQTFVGGDGYFIGLVDPADVISVPKESGTAKIRVKRAMLVGITTKDSFETITFDQSFSN